MHRLIYCSTATNLLNKQDLIDILTKARDKNGRLGVTGMLLYKGGNFLQLLEGDEDAIHQLYGTISLDKRHHGAMILLDETATERLFPDWTMGFQDLSDPELDALPGFASFRNLSLTYDGFGQDAQACLDVLRFFRDSR